MAAAAGAPDSDSRIIHAINVLCGMNPADSKADSEAIAGLLGDEDGDTFLEKADRPLEVAVCPVTHKKYLKCDYNRDGDSYRSPWSNQYDPPVAPDEDGEEAFAPEGSVRALEVTANELLAVYASQYFGSGAVSSAYLWDQEDGGVAACFLVRHEGAGEVARSAWNGVHVLDATPVPGASDGSFEYKLTSSVVLEVDLSSGELGATTLSGAYSSRDRRVAVPPPGDAAGGSASHVAVWGPMVESMESRMRESLGDVFVFKAMMAMASARAAGPAAAPTDAKAALVSSLKGALAAQGAKRAALDA